MPRNSVTKDEVKRFLKESSYNGAEYGETNGYYYVKPNKDYVFSRVEKEKYSQKMWQAAYRVTHIIKRFPFVLCVMVTGTLSKNSSDKSSDLDFMVITAPKRLWIARTLLMLFKKIFLLNSKKYFCINYCITEDNMEISERNIFTATEIATIKATYNDVMMKRFIESNKWIKDFFPNYILNDPSLHASGCKIHHGRSVFQAAGEIFFPGRIGDKLDNILMRKTIRHWKKKFPHFNEEEFNSRLKSTHNESRVHPGSVQAGILKLYNEKLTKFNL